MEKSRSRSASPGPKKQKPLLLELNVASPPSAHSHIYYVSRSLQLVEPISGPSSWEVVTMKAISVNSHDMVRKILNLPNRNWMVE